MSDGTHSLTLCNVSPDLSAMLLSLFLSFPVCFWTIHGWLIWPQLEQSDVDKHIARCNLFPKEFPPSNVLHYSVFGQDELPPFPRYHLIDTARFVFKRLSYANLIIPLYVSIIRSTFLVLFSDQFLFGLRRTHQCLCSLSVSWCSFVRSFVRSFVHTPNVPALPLCSLLSKRLPLSS